MSVPWRLGKKKPYEKQEARTAKKDGARPQLNSGRRWDGKGDVKRLTKFGTFLYDNKTRGVGGFTLTARDFLKLKKQANSTPPGCMPVFQVDLKSTDETKLIRLVIIEEDVFDEMLDRL